MKSTSGRITWQEAVPRVIADFVMVHLSMVAALALSVVYQVAVGSGMEAQALTGDFTNYYTRFFWMMSPIFPVIFALNGFYTHTRSYASRQKNWVILRTVLVAVLLFFGLNTFFGGNTVTGKSVALPFMVFAAVALCGSRILKGYIEDRFDVKPKNGITTTSGKSQVLVVGGAGYIGSLLSERLLQMGYRVRVLDSLLYGKESLRPIENHPEFELMVGDCRNIRDVIRAVRGVEAIVHLAAIVGDPACEQDRDAALEINYAATRMMIEVAKGHGVGRMLFASSCSVYGATDIEMGEKSKVSPISLYAQTKVDSEQALLGARSDEFHPTILRFATVFGLGYRPRFDLVVNLLSAKAKQDGTITIFNGQQWRPFIHVRDIVEAMICTLRAPVRLVSGETFNVGDSRLNHTLQDVAEIVQEVFPGTRVEQVENADRRNYRVNFDKIRDRLGFSARYTIRDGVEELKAAFEQGLIQDYKDLRYNNQRFLQMAGAVGNKNEIDSLIMAAFANVRNASVPDPIEGQVVTKRPPAEVLKVASASA
jgi:nucleoside-diphosphate-sugar epimerase